MTKKIFRKGVKYLCTNSASPAYKKGHTYMCYLNEDRDLCFMGDDGIEDLTKMLVSSFEEINK